MSEQSTRLRHRASSDPGDRPRHFELGFETSKGRYVTFSKFGLDDLRAASTRAIEVTDFVSLDDIDPIYYERTYWLAPADETAVKPYQLAGKELEIEPEEGGEPKVIDLMQALEESVKGAGATRRGRRKPRSRARKSA